MKRQQLNQRTIYL